MREGPGDLFQRLYRGLFSNLAPCVQELRGFFDTVFFPKLSQFLFHGVDRVKRRMDLKQVLKAILLRLVKFFVVFQEQKTSPPEVLFPVLVELGLLLSFCLLDAFVHQRYFNFPYS